MRDTRSLGTGHVVDIVVYRIQSADSNFEGSGLGIVENNDTEAIAGIVNIASSTDSVEDNIVLFAAASNENVDSGNVIGNKAQLGAVTFLHSRHRPEVVHHAGKGNGEFDTNKDPGQDEGGTVGLLSGDDTVDSVSQVGQVRGRVDKGE